MTDIPYLPGDDLFNENNIIRPDNVEDTTEDNTNENTDDSVDWTEEDDSDLIFWN